MFYADIKLFCCAFFTGVLIVGLIVSVRVSHSRTQCQMC